MTNNELISTRNVAVMSLATLTDSEDHWINVRAVAEALLTERGLTVPKGNRRMSRV